MDSAGDQLPDTPEVDAVLDPGGIEDQCPEDLQVGGG
jgi:hypothetical protein